jgi:hypothetical protein
MDSLNVLCEAKKEYTAQLCLIMCPVMIETFQELYETAVRDSKNKKPLLQFQKHLKEVPNWSNAMSKNHSDNITDRCAWFADLLAAVFVSFVKILSSVRLRAENKKISLKVPSNEVFIQTCYNNCAKDLYRDPYVFHEEQSEYERDLRLTKRFTECIEATVKELIPVAEILKTYMSTEDKNIDLEPSNDMPTPEEDDVVEDDGFDAQEPAAEEPAEPAEPGVEAAVPASDEVPPMGLENEFKTIPEVPAPPEEQEEEEEEEHAPPTAAPVPEPIPAPAPTFFNDAPEARKKPEYI